MIHIAELISRVTVTRPPPDALASPAEAPGPTTFPLEYAERVVPAIPTVPTADAPRIQPAAATPTAVDPRLIAELVYRLMRDDLAISRERA